MDELELGMLDVSCVFTINELALMASIMENSRDDDGDLAEVENSLLKKIETYESSGMLDGADWECDRCDESHLLKEWKDNNEKCPSCNLGDRIPF